jgi:hypothetical protein
MIFIADVLKKSGITAKSREEIFEDCHSGGVSLSLQWRRSASLTFSLTVHAVLGR